MKNGRDIEMNATAGGDAGSVAQSIGPTQRWGASPEDWSHFNLVLGLGADLLPVVSNPHATIAPRSQLKQTGKVPTEYNRHRKVRGIKDWTLKRSDLLDLEQWRREPDYGICVQTRHVRGIDIDVADPVKAAAIEAAVVEFLGLVLPARRRANSGKCLLAVRVPGRRVKRSFVTGTDAAGKEQIVEFLATGQQFIAIGTHPSGARYEWDGGLPGEIPEIPGEQFEALWQALEKQFKTGDRRSSVGRALERQRGQRIQTDDPVAEHLEANGWVVDRDDRAGMLHIRCPWSEEHTSGTDGDTSTSWLIAGTNGYAVGHFSCRHAHCTGRTDAQFLEAVGYDERPLIQTMFSPVVDDDDGDAAEKGGPRFKLMSITDLAALPPVRLRVRGVLPTEGLAAIYGAPGSGKSFLALDLLAAVAAGRPWFGRRTDPAPVVYVALEGEGGIAQRVAAYQAHHGRALGGMWFVVQPFALLASGDVSGLAGAIRAVGAAGGIVVIDTLNRASPGADENDSRDMGRVIDSAKALQTELGGLVVLVHHSGKDAAKGLRGHSSLLAALDASVEVVREGDRREWRTSKAKDGADGEAHPFRLEVVALGHDEHNESITSCVVVPDEPGAGRRSARPKGENQRTALDALAAVLDVIDRPDDAPADVPQGCGAIRVEQGVDAVAGSLICDPKRRGERARDSIRRLIDGGFLRHSGGWIWLA